MNAAATQAGSTGRSRAEKALRSFHEEGAIGKAYDARLLRRLWPYVRPHARFLSISLATLLLVAMVNLARPLLMGDVVRQASAKDPNGL
ncbi:MAG TPA: ABC transporter ATP-binding protein, partial [Polyangiaceae bacterium]|nr:ABC transporter ATP-binding protein [Polyangiaceae bacterium]